MTGNAVFAYDMEIPRMLYGKIHRSRLPHAEILSINIRKALKVPGVRSIITGKDVSDGLRGRGLLDTPILAHNKVRYVENPSPRLPRNPWTALKKLATLLKEGTGRRTCSVRSGESHRTQSSGRDSSRHWKVSTAQGENLQGRSDPTRPNITNYFKVRQGDIDEPFATQTA